MGPMMVVDQLPTAQTLEVESRSAEHAKRIAQCRNVKLIADLIEFASWPFDSGATFCGCIATICKLFNAEK